MKRVFLAALVLAITAVPSYADVTIRQSMTGKGMGMSGKMTGTTYIKGNRMRSETVAGDRTLITVFDLDAQKMYSWDSKKKEADVWDMQAFAAEMSKNVEVSDIKASVKPNGQSKEIAGKTATGYDMLITMPTAIGGDKEMTMTVTLSGPVWIVKDAPGTDDYMRFYRAAAEKGWIFSDPRAAKGNPGQARSMTEMYRQFAETGGIAYQSDIEIRMGAAEGGAKGGLGGMMGGLFAKMGNMSSSTMVESIDTAPLADDLFAPPAGFKLKQQK